PGRRRHAALPRRRWGEPGLFRGHLGADFRSLGRHLDRHAVQSQPGKGKPRTRAAHGRDQAAASGDLGREGRLDSTERSRGDGRSDAGLPPGQDTRRRSLHECGTAGALCWIFRRMVWRAHPRRRVAMMIWRSAVLVIAVLLSALTSAMAQGNQGNQGTQATQPASEGAPQQPAANLLKPEQLDALVAPIALYPDPLLVNVLAAATYPLEVVQADRWASENKNLKGDQLKAAVDKQAWDDSVKALVSTPSVLAMMSQKLDWTQKLGDALLAQQPDVMDAIQRLRTKAYDNKKRMTTKQQTVTVQQDQGRQTIVIQPAVADQVYVPYYDPATVYGSWPYADYPPYYFGYPSYIGAGVIAAGLAFGAAYAIGRWGNYWGGGARWGNNNFFI